MTIRCVWEHNGPDTLLYACDYPGAFARGCSLEIALSKMPLEIISYCRWIGLQGPDTIECKIVQEVESALQICDADSDVLFDTERAALVKEEYEMLKSIVLRSAQDFQSLYEAIPDKHQSCLKVRKTFYGQLPRTAQEMYNHTKNVNDYYFGEIGVNVDHHGDIFECRKRGFAVLEQQENYLNNPVFNGSYGELWTLRKLMRRFIWHDRIHARAMYRMAQRTFIDAEILDPFYFMKESFLHEL